MKSRGLLLAIAIVSLLFFLTGNGSLPVTDPVESNYALTAKEMVLSGDWISPRIFGTFWYDKPVFIYWMLSLSYTLLGFSDFASRLPGAVFGMGSVVLFSWYLLRRGTRRELAVLGAAVMATSLEVWAVSHSIITDQILFFFTEATLFSAYIGLTEKRSSYMTAAYAMAALAVLTKGPVGIVLPGTFLLAFAALRRDTSLLRRIFQPQGIVLFLLLCLPWYGIMYHLHGTDFIDGFLGLHNIARATASEHPEVNVWYYYLVLIPVSLLPWTGPALYGAWRHRHDGTEYQFMMIWALGTILFYTLVATKYPTYAYIANIPLLLYAVLGIGDLYEKNKARLWTILTGPAIFWWLLFAAVPLFFKKAAFVPGSWIGLYIFIPLSIVLLLAAQKTHAFPALPVMTAVGTAVIYILVLYQGLVPFYGYRSASVFQSQKNVLQGQLYFFEEYRTSFTYYTGRTALYTEPAGYDENARLHRSSVWAGKHPFPEEDSAHLMARLTAGEMVTILVPRGRYDDYIQSEFYPLTREAGKIGACYVFYTKEALP